MRALRERLVPMAAVVTPNTEEAAILTGVDTVESADDIRRAAERRNSLAADRKLHRRCGERAKAAGAERLRL